MTIMLNSKIALDGSKVAQPYIPNPQVNRTQARSNLQLYQTYQGQIGIRSL